MTPSKLRRALLAGTIVAAPLTLLSTLLVLGGQTAVFANFVLLALLFATAFVSAWYLHGGFAVVVSAILSAPAFVLFITLVRSPEAFVALDVFTPWIFAGAVVGALLGILARPWIRRRFDR